MLAKSLEINYFSSLKIIVFIFFTAILVACQQQMASAPPKTAIGTEESISQSLPHQTDTATIQPTQPKTPTDSPTSTAQTTPTISSLVVFSLSAASNELPENFMDQITYFGGQGGPGSGDWDHCEGVPRNKPALLIEPQEETCLYCDVFLQSCGWSNNENIVITVQLADGESFKVDETADKYGYVEYRLVPTIDDIPGGYTIAVKGTKDRLKVKFNKLAPEDTGVFWDQNHILLLATGHF